MQGSKLAPQSKLLQSQHSVIHQSANMTHGQTPYTIIVSDSPGEQEDLQAGTSQVVYQQQAYVDDPADSVLYSSSGTQIQAYTNEYGQAMYTPVSGSYYSASQPSHVSHSSSYIIQGSPSMSDTHVIGQGTCRASPATPADLGQRSSHFDMKSWQREVQWLLENFEKADGVSLPRCTMYSCYLRYCAHSSLDPVNTATFGKLVHSVFSNLTTRRLGTRGNSKYHYYGIRIKNVSTLNQFTEDQAMPHRQQPNNSFKRFKPSSSASGGGSGGSEAAAGSDAAAQQLHQQFLGDASVAVPDVGHIIMETDDMLPEDLTMEDVLVFEQLYKEHCEAILDVIVNLQFSLVEALWQSFWRTGSDGPETEAEQRLSKDKLYDLCRVKAVCRFVSQSDLAFYQALVEVLIPDVLRPIPSTLTQAIRNFAKGLEGWLKSAIVGVPDSMVKVKANAVSVLAQTLRRYTSLNHLAQAARAVLQNPQQIDQMLADLNKVDFANVQEQASWVCQCEEGVIDQLQLDFKRTLKHQNSLEQWAQWLEGVTNRLLQPHEGQPHFAKAARQFLLKWSFYSSMVIRDLTLRSAASFGSFHLIRLLYDEYMFYLIEHKVALATGDAPIAVMGDMKQMMDIHTMVLGMESQAAGTVSVRPKAGASGNTPRVVYPSTNGLSTVNGGASKQ